MRTIILLLLLYIFTYPTPATAQIPYIDSREVLLRGVAYNDTGAYKKALECFRQVHECDTNYATAVYEEVNTLIADSSYDDAKRLAISGLRLPDADKRDFLLALGNAYDYLNKQDSAMAVYASLMKLYPYDNRPWYEAGVVNYRQKKYDTAAYYFQRSLLMNPYHFRSHYMLGNVYALQGRLTESMIALETSLLMTKDGGQAKSAIGVISSIVEQTDEISKIYAERTEKYSNPVFDEIDQIVNAKLAFNKEYKLKMTIDDNIFRQTQAIMEKLRYEPGDTTFTMQFYVPLLTEVYKKDMFESYILLTYSNFGFENIDNLAKKKKSAVDETSQLVFPYYTQIQGTQVLNYAQRIATKAKYHFYPADNFILVGTINGEGKSATAQGDVVLYRSNHSLLGEGSYADNGDKQGRWRYYYSSGQLKTDEVYKNSVLIDTIKEYYDNGNLKKVTVMDNTGAVTAEYEYAYKGNLSTALTKINATESEETTYYMNGRPEATILLAGKNVKDGTYKSYYHNGGLKKELNARNGKYDGLCKKYYGNGQLSSEQMYENGNQEGVCTEYFENGKIKNKYNYHNDKCEGAFEEYWDNGKLSETGTYHKGKKDGLDTRFDNKGHKYCEIELRNNVPQSLKYFDAKDKIFYKRDDGNSVYNYSLYYMNGNKSADMKINTDGLREGNITFYYYSGSKSDEINYKNGNRDGNSVSFYKDGKKRIEESYKNDNLDGYYKSYFSNGNLEEEGWYKDGDKQGLWKTYSVNGKILYETYFQNGYKNGYQKVYNINGQLSYKDMNTYNMLTGCVKYDTLGNITDSTYYPRGTGHHRLAYKNGVTSYEIDVKYGQINGPYTKKYYTGALRETGSYKYADRDSACIGYYPDGTKQYEGKYNEGTKTGVWRYYNEAGELTDEELHTAYPSKVNRKLYACNQLRMEYNLLNNSKDSAQIYYGENGRIACVLYYDTGDLEAYSYEGPDGKLLPAIPVKNGTVDITAYYSNGKKSAELKLVEGACNGPQKIYYTNGNISEERNYEMRDLNGPFKRYTPDGKLCYDATYKYDELNGTEKTYDKSGTLEVSKDYYFGEAHGHTTVVNVATQKAKNYNYYYGELINAGE